MVNKCVVEPTVLNLVSSDNSNGYVGLKLPFHVCVCIFFNYKLKKQYIIDNAIIHLINNGYKIPNSEFINV